MCATPGGVQETAQFGKLLGRDAISRQIEFHFFKLNLT
jgi:hypothetical protein